jgi:large subunit ribosomal protein L29
MKADKADQPNSGAPSPAGKPRTNKLRGLESAELVRQSQDAQEQLFRLRFQMGMGQYEGLKKYRTLKKDRARLLTILTEKGVAEPVAAQVRAIKATAAEPKKKSGLFKRFTREKKAK